MNKHNYNYLSAFFDILIYIFYIDWFENDLERTL